MRHGKTTPTRGDLAARPTVKSDDQFAERSVRQRSSDTQHAPEGDNRYRVTPSAKFYVVQLMGAWVNVVESAERSVRSRNGLRWVTFEKREYQLRKADTFKPFVGRFLQLGCYAYVGGKQVDDEKAMREIESFRFIYIASTGALAKFNALRIKNSGRGQA